MKIHTALGPNLEPFRLAPAVASLFIVSLAYYIGAMAAFAIGTLTQMFAPFWPPNVVLLCALLAVPERRWWMYVLAVFPAHVAAELGVAMPAPQLLLAFACNVAFALLNAIALRRVLVGPPWLGDLRKASAYLLIAVILVPGLVAFAGGAEPLLGDGEGSRYWDYWWRWFLSNALGSLTLTPVYLTWADGGLRALRLVPRRRRLEAAALVLGLAATCVLAFGVPIQAATDQLLPALLYTPIPLLVWAAVRFGVKGASGAILVVTVLSLWQAMEGYGPFAATAPGQSVLALQLFLAVISTPILLLAALIEELHRTNDRLTGVLDGISDCYYTLDRQWRFTAVNPKALSWLRSESASATIGQSYWNVTDSASDAPFIRRAMDENVTVHVEIASSVSPEQWVELNAYPMADGVSVFFRDISKRKAAELAAHETRVLLQSTVDALSAHVAILDATGTIVAVNAAWRRFAEANGYRGADHGIGTSYLAVCDAAAMYPEAVDIAAGLRALAAGAETELRVEYSWRRDGAPPLWFQLRATRFGEGSGLRIVLAHEDITETKRGEAALRVLTARLLDVQDQERRRIARELHDSTAQNLLGASLGVARAMQLAPEMVTKAKDALGESEALIQQAQMEIRTVSYLLHPPMLEEAGLNMALTWYVRGFSQRSSIAVTFAVSPELSKTRLPDDIELALFRVVQEGLTNVHRHSGSATARIRVECERAWESEDRVVLTIEDHGHGLPRELADSTRGGQLMPSMEKVGVGLAGMQERLHQLGGCLEVRSSANGTTVRAIVPLRPSLKG
jgi:signal transduction histidine kinase